MNKTFEEGKDEIARLCRYFSSNRLAFLAPGIKEAHVRQSLIDPFFEALGWDVRNASMTAPQYATFEDLKRDLSRKKMAYNKNRKQSAAGAGLSEPGNARKNNGAA